MTYFEPSFTDKTTYWNKFCAAQPPGNKPPKTRNPPHMMAMLPQPLHVKRFPNLFAHKRTQSIASLVSINPSGYFPVRQQPFLVGRT